MRDAMLASDAGTEAGLARIEQAYDDLAASDSKSAFRGYSEIGATHSKILRALELPGDLERLADANKSIEALALTFKSVASGL